MKRILSRGTEVILILRLKVNEPSAHCVKNFEESNLVFGISSDLCGSDRVKALFYPTASHISNSRPVLLLNILVNEGSSADMLTIAFTHREAL